MWPHVSEPTGFGDHHHKGMIPEEYGLRVGKHTPYSAVKHIHAKTGYAPFHPRAFG